jgi:hypothetical protein
MVGLKLKCFFVGHARVVAASEVFERQPKGMTSLGGGSRRLERLPQKMPSKIHVPLLVKQHAQQTQGVLLERFQLQHSPVQCLRLAQPALLMAGQRQT